MSRTVRLLLLGALLAAALPARRVFPCPAEPHGGAAVRTGAVVLRADPTPASGPAEAAQRRDASALRPPASGDDRLLHFLAGVSSCLVAEALVYPPVGARPQAPYLVAGTGFVSALAAGLVKETVDAAGFGDPSWRDLMDTAAGGLVAASASLLLVNQLQRSGGAPAAGAAAFGCFAAVLAAPVARALLEEIRRSSARRRTGGSGGP